MRIFGKSLRLAAFRSSGSGSIAIEFVLVLPIFVGIMIATNEFTRFLRARQHLHDYAAMVAYDIAGAAAPVTAESLREMIQRFGLVVPELVDPTQTAWSNDPSNYLAVGITMVAMTPATPAIPATPTTRATPACTTLQSGCTYKGFVAWSFGNYTRVCSDPTLGIAEAPVAAPDPQNNDTRNNLPSGAFQQNAIVVVDVKVTYKPLFANGFNLNAFGSTQLNLSLSPTLTTFAWQPVRNWRGTGTSSYPGLATTSAGVWTGSSCTGVT